MRIKIIALLLALTLAIVPVSGCISASAAETREYIPPYLPSTPGVTQGTEDDGEDESGEFEAATPGITRTFAPVVPAALPAVGTSLSASQLPFTYTGSMQAYEYSPGKFYAMLLSNGTFTARSAITFDVFLVGGGAAGRLSTGTASYAAVEPGGGGGYTRTIRNVSMNNNSTANIIIGAGGVATGRPDQVGNTLPLIGGATSFGTYQVNGGGLDSGNYYALPQYGGSGGGSGNADAGSVYVSGGSNGGNGFTSDSYGNVTGLGSGGQGTTTYAFEGDISPFNTSNFLFAGGGGGGAAYADYTLGGAGGGGNGGGRTRKSEAGAPNTGGGGGGAMWAFVPGGTNISSTGSNGGSGIVIIRGEYDVAPSAPPSITVPASILYNSAYTVSWGTSTSASNTLGGYKLERQINGGTWTQIYQGTATSYSQTMTRDQANTVNYRVKAYSTGNLESGYATGTARTVTNNRVPTTPTGMTNASTVNSWQSSSVAFSWNASTDADSDTIYYVVERSLNGGTWTTMQNSTARSYTHNISITGDNSVQIRVRSYDSREYSSAYLTSSVVSIVHDTAPTAPSSITVPTPILYGSAYTVSWGAATSSVGTLTGYKLERQINGGAWSQIYDGTATSYSQTMTRDQANTVNYRVKAYSITGLQSGYTTGTERTVTNNRVPTQPPSWSAQPSSSVNSWQTTSLTWSWSTSTDADSDTVYYVVERSIGGGTWLIVQNSAALSYTHNVSIPGDSYVQIRVRAYDNREYSGYLTSGTATVTHDTTKPTIQVIAVPDATTDWVKDEITITVIVSDSQSGLKSLTVPAGATPAGNQTLSGMSDSKTFKVTANGTYSFTITDNAGNSNSASISPSKIDTDFPTITYTTTPPDGEFTNGDVTINLNMGDISSGLKSLMSFNGEESLSGKTAARSFTVSSNGIVPFTVTDIVGHSTPINVNINMIDRVKPVTSIVPQVAQWTNSASVLLDVSAVDDYSGIKSITLPDGSIYTSGTAASYEIFNNGICTASSKDKAGNISDSATINYNWFDRTPPTIQVIHFEPVENPLAKFFANLFNIVTNTHLRIKVTGDDTPEPGEGESGITHMYYRVFKADGTLMQDWTESPISAKPTIDYEVNGYAEVYVKDAAGNVSDIETNYIIIDATPPVAEYSLSETELTNQPVIAVISASDEPDGSGFKGWMLPDGGVLVTQPLITYTFERNADKTFIAYDNAGNETRLVVTVNNIEREPPVIWSIDVEEVSEGGILGVVISLFNKTAYNIKIRVEISATDDVELDKIYYCITPGTDIPDDAVWMETDGVLYFDDEIDGVIHAKATDMAGNVSNIMSRAIKIDRLTPELTYELDERENEYAPVIFKVTATDDTSTGIFSGIDYIVNPLGVQEQTDYIEYAVIENGSYSFKAVDMAGNETVLTVDIDNILQIKREDWEDNQPVIDAILHATSKHNIEDVKYADMQGITFLDMSSNGIKELPYILRLATRLEYLDLRGNELKTVPECVYEFKNLKYLDLSNNNLTEIGSRIAGLKNLGELDVSLNYLVDYDCPIIVPKYRDIGNFTLNNREDQYSFKVLDPVTTKEYIGNMAQINIEWSYGGKVITDNLEKHRKALYVVYYHIYHTYRPMLFKYEIQNGQAGPQSADYTQVYLDGTGVMLVTLKLGAA